MPTTVFGRRLDYVLWAAVACSAVAAHLYFVGLWN
jgi:hypothetical protein